MGTCWKYGIVYEIHIFHLSRTFMNQGKLILILTKGEKKWVVGGKELRHLFFFLCILEDQ
jgi:hypothetical protein